jgi:hypothetical protein
MTAKGSQTRVLQAEDPAIVGNIPGLPLPMQHGVADLDTALQHYSTAVLPQACACQGRTQDTHEGIQGPLKLTTLT